MKYQWPTDKLTEITLDEFSNSYRMRGWYVHIPRSFYGEMVKGLFDTVRFVGQEFQIARGDMEFNYHNNVKLVPNDLLNINMEEFYAKNSNK